MPRSLSARCRSCPGSSGPKWQLRPVDGTNCQLSSAPHRNQFLPQIMNYFHEDSRSAYDAKADAQRIAFAPLMFQACRILRDSGILESVHRSGSSGQTLDQVAAKISLSRYAVKVLLEAGLGVGLFWMENEHYRLTKLGYFLLRDPMTRVNMDFVQEVCYRGFFELERSLREGFPAGL